MLYTGIDYYKKSSAVSTLDATGARVRESCIDENEPGVRRFTSKANEDVTSWLLTV